MFGKRDSAGTVEIGSDADGAIVEMVNVGERLIAIKENAVYELIFADKVDPKREHPNLPSTTQKLILKIGTHSELFSKVFITAKQLVNTQFLLQTIDVNKILIMTLDLVHHMKSLNDHIVSYFEEEKTVIEQYEKRKMQKNLDHAIPSISDIVIRCRTIFQKADHVLQTQMEIVRIFYPDFGTQYFNGFQIYIEKKYGKDDIFYRFLDGILQFIDLTRDVRNCLEHRRDEITISDFTMKMNGDILKPSIEIKYKSSVLAQTDLAVFLKTLEGNILDIIETFIPHLCIKNITGNRLFGNEIRVIPNDVRRNKFVQYAFWSPFGTDGYYHQ